MQSQEVEQTQEQIEDFIKEFNYLGKEEFKAYAEKNLERLQEANVLVQLKAQTKHDKLFGEPLFKAVTPVPEPVQQESLDPKECNYRVSELCTAIEWSTARQKRNKRFVEMFELQAVLKSTGQAEEITHGLFLNQLEQFVGADIAREIEAQFKAKEKSGTVKCDRKFKIMGFWKVIFLPKTKKEDTEDVFLTVNSNCLQLQRDKAVVLPGSYLEVSDRGTYPTFTQKPGIDRKITGWISFYPYRTITRSTKKEFVKQKAEGDRLTKEARERAERIE